MKRVLLMAVGLVLVCAVPAFAQKEKFKNKNKDKRFETVVKPAAEYAGRYIGFDAEHYIEVKADVGGQLSVTIFDGARRRAQLKDVKLEQGKLTATKVYENGETRPFEATFANRIMYGVSLFGMIVEDPVTVDPNLTINRVFYRRQ